METFAFLELYWSLALRRCGCTGDEVAYRLRAVSLLLKTRKEELETTSACQRNMRSREPYVARALEDERTSSDAHATRGSRLLHSPLVCHACRHAHFPYGFSRKRETARSLGRLREVVATRDSPVLTSRFCYEGRLPVMRTEISVRLVISS